MDKLIIAGRSFSSRLMVGTGKFASHRLMADALVASAAKSSPVALPVEHRAARTTT
ncbi:MAG: hypothetical protein R2864_06775 [Syntrophotaleaceae bacterium]